MKQWLLVRFTLATLLVDKLDQVGVVVKIVPAFVLISSTVINTRGQVVADSNLADVAVVHDTPATLSGSGAHDANATVHLFAAVPKHDGTSKCVFVCPWTSKSSWRGFFGLDFHNSMGPMRIGSFEVWTFFSGFSLRGACFMLHLIIHHAFGQGIHEAIATQVLAVLVAIHDIV